MTKQYALSCKGEIVKGKDKGDVIFALMDKLNLAQDKAERLLSNKAVTILRASEMTQLKVTQERLLKLGLITHISLQPTSNYLQAHLRDTSSLEDNILKKVHQAKYSLSNEGFNQLIFNSKAEFDVSSEPRKKELSFKLLRKTAFFSQSAAGLLAMLSSYFIMQHLLKTSITTILPAHIATMIGLLSLGTVFLVINALFNANHVYVSNHRSGIWCRSTFWSSPLHMVYQVYDQDGDILGQIRHGYGLKTWTFCDETGVELYRCEYEWGHDEKVSELAEEMRDELIDFDYFTQLADIGRRLLRMAGINLKDEQESKAAWVVRDIAGSELGKWSGQEDITIEAGCLNQQELHLVVFFQLLMAGKTV
ncbi:hypothetical protein [Motilimonas pumila]|uniref:Uncharacterized protein n=1 Tax=Motilimonas pumila TaxID=2303987 RepID=A0A418YK51_9GAMM|nr:hypothetical protein [Motilimonas pumila]RJG51354.1 hypothetical protein D1Z90_01060 [Motilimonas pumila]